MTFITWRSLSATLVFDLVDDYAARRGIRGAHPRPFGEIRLLATAQVIGGVAQPLLDPVELVTRSGPAGYHVFFGDVRLPDGSLRQHLLAAGTYVVRVESTFYQPAERTDIALPRPDQPYRFNLKAGYRYPFPVNVDRASATLLRGTLYQIGGRGVAGAVVSITGLPDMADTCTTDPTGQWVLVFPDGLLTADTNVTVRVVYPGGVVVVDVPVVLVRPRRSSSLLQAGLRGSVLTRSGLGIANATIRVSGEPGTVTTDRHGRWSYYFGLNQGNRAGVSVTATLPNGNELTQANLLIRRRATVSVPAFRFDQG